MITEEQIKARISELTEARERLRSDLIATSGAIQDCEYWLSVLEKQDKQLVEAE